MKPRSPTSIFYVKNMLSVPAADPNGEERCLAFVSHILSHPRLTWPRSAIAGLSSLYCLLPAQSIEQTMQTFSWVGGDLIVRIGVGFFVVALTVGGSIGGSMGAAMAQTYYPPPPDYYYPPPRGGYYPPPPDYYTPSPDDYDYPVPAHSRAPTPPVDVGPPVPAYPPGYAQPAPPPYPPPPGRTYYGYPDQTAEQPVPADVPRPPSKVGGAPDVTGSINPSAPPATQQSGATVIAGLPPEDQPESSGAELPPQLHRQLVDYATSEPAGTIIIDTPHTFLYLVLGRGKALRYGVGVGREGFTWSGTERISHRSEWPDWHPPKEMIERQPYLPRFMAGGEGNPLGARALYLGNTVYRIHGTNQPSTIGHFVSSGCIRLTNGDIEDLYGRVNVGTRVVVLSGSPPASASAQGAIAH
jgi:lipoprotein-anchoring transpeptidase ErfK/SrfK